MRLCPSCFYLHRRTGICDACVKSTPGKIARQHDRRVKQLRRHLAQLQKDVRIIELLVGERERKAARLRSIDSTSWRRVEGRRRLLELALMESPSETLQ